MSWRGYSVFGILLALLAAMMLIPALVAFANGDRAMASIFLASAVITAVCGGIMLVATYSRVGRSEIVGEFSTLLAALLVAPMLAAIPIVLAHPFLTIEASYFEMVSSFTTTGATVFDVISDVHPMIHLWRGMTGWLGGLIVLVMAFALLAPRSLGGFEVRGDIGRTAAIGRLRGLPLWAGGGDQEAAGDRVAAAVTDIAPVYVALTGVLFALFLMTGLEPLTAAVTAMGVISTSGISTGDQSPFSGGGFLAELIAACFLFLAATRHSYSGSQHFGARLPRMIADPEVQLLAVVVVGVSVWLFLRHWLGVLVLVEGDPIPPVAAFWGTLFTILSFATTAGYESAYWGAARAWTGLDSPALVLFGLALTGGGVATTAGGIKLLRAYALFKHGTREMERLIRPSSIAGTGASKRGLRREGAQIAWVFVMLFLVALAVSVLAVSLTGVEFERAVAVSVAAISNTGPVFGAVESGSSWLTSISAEARAILVVVMVLGRVELLALIALLNTDNWT